MGKKSFLEPKEESFGYLLKRYLLSVLWGIMLMIFFFCCWIVGWLWVLFSPIEERMYRIKLREE